MGRVFGATESYSAALMSTGGPDEVRVFGDMAVEASSVAIADDGCRSSDSEAGGGNAAMQVLFDRTFAVLYRINPRNENHEHRGY